MNRTYILILVTGVLNTGVSLLDAQTAVTATTSGARALAVQINLAVTPKPKIVPNIDPKAVWLLESAAAKLRAARTVKAVNRTYHYYPKQDTAVNTIITDTIRFDRSKGEYRYQATLSENGFYWYVHTISPEDCVFYSRNVNPEAGMGKMSLAQVEAELMPKAFATAAQGEATRCMGSWVDNLWFPSAMQALNPREVGQRMDFGEWGIERLDDPLLHSVTYEGKKVWNGKTYDVVQFSYETAATLPKQYMVYTTTMYIDTDQIVRRVITTNSKGNYSTDDQIQSIELGTPIADSELTWKLPAGALLKDPRPNNKKSALGQTIRKFTGTGQLLDGTVVTASELMKEKKATLFWFWNTGCSSCAEKFPHLEQLYNEYKDQRIQIVAVNVVEPKHDLANSREYQAYHQSNMPIVFVSGDWNDWTQENSFYVVDATGKIVYEIGNNFNKAKLRSLFTRLISH